MPSPTLHPRRKAKPGPRDGKGQVRLDSRMRADARTLVRLGVGRTAVDAVRAALRLTAEIGIACEAGASLSLARPGQPVERVRILAGGSVL